MTVAEWNYYTGDALSTDDVEDLCLYGSKHDYDEDFIWVDNVWSIQIGTYGFSLTEDLKKINKKNVGEYWVTKKNLKN